MVFLSLRRFFASLCFVGVHDLREANVARPSPMFTCPRECGMVLQHDITNTCILLCTKTVFDPIAFFWGDFLGDLPLVLPVGSSATCGAHHRTSVWHIVINQLSFWRGACDYSTTSPKAAVLHAIMQLPL